MIRNMYAVIHGPNTGQGLIIVEHRTSANAGQHYNCILWPSARVVIVHEDELSNSDAYELLEQLPQEIFDPYYRAYKQLTQKLLNEHPNN